ncbi:CO(2)-response secreted protease [Actinidia chinensis var. chinensis]|uniref:CO(2)-response secreted protease n=1 Tax=Actinidia chinensis var. chinensis TaxID=1590841 RepID=A0A2R6PZH6_ACTCC|nr:CO(2)-response secreted protease [Actinidia chinensis var. chinensis]
MKGLSILFFFFFYFSLFLLSLLGEAKAGEDHNDGVYIVYMGAATSPNGTLRDDRTQILTSLSKRERNALVRTYKNGFSGFAARLTKEEAKSMVDKPGVVSVFPDPILKLHTTHSWDFLKYQTDLEIDSSSSSDSDSSSQESDTIIGILDTGIWPESPSFTDSGMGPIPSRWNGTCMEGQDFTSSHCNRKLIGARYYQDPVNEDSSNHTPRDKMGHGTHVASTAGGNPISGASYYGVAQGTARGGSPGSRIAVYRVCSYYGCLGSAVLAAFDDAIADGVDVLSLSIGTEALFGPELSDDPIAIGAFHAVEHGITVVCSAGNDGPGSESIANIAPWILTVAATTIDRDFESTVVLGNNKVIKGGGISFGNLQKAPIYPLIYGLDAKKNSRFDEIDDDDARNCKLNALDDDKVRGKIVVCEHIENQYSDNEKLDGIISQGGIGVILVDDDLRFISSTYGSSPMSVITKSDFPEVLTYLHLTRSPVATILPTVSVTKYKPAPVVPYFSSRGPTPHLKRLLKPDIAAPGVNILAAWRGNDTSEALKGKAPPLFYVLSGTSMSCPHVSGIAAAVKSQFPTWGPSAIKSAIMTTATQTNNMKGPITTDSGAIATPYDYGAGEVTTTRPLQPGLVYETNSVDYLEFLCVFGYDISKIKLISTVVPDGFTCPKGLSADLISNMNYPSIAISGFDGKESKMAIRTVTNVGVDDETLYTATLDVPTGLKVEVMPEKLQFTKSNKKLGYRVIFTSTTSSQKEDLFGSITWTNGKYKVRTPFVVTS